LAERVNGCFERSLNGKALPEKSQEMQAILAYMQWLSQDIPQGAKMQGQGLPDIDLLDRAADPNKGKTVYTAKCAVCHQPTGAGMLMDAKKPAMGYVYPALWGQDSYNTGAGMHRVITAAKYIKANMPFGNPNLSAEEAFDVAAYINSQMRPAKAHLENDFPDRSKKPVDAAFPPWPDTFSAQQHKYGPFKVMLNGKEQGS
jgi:thiosulfate dehydrogenase